MTRLICAILILGAAGCGSRYVGPGSGAREERVEQREEKKAESTAPVDPRVTPVQTQRSAEDSGLPVAR